MYVVSIYYDREPNKTPTYFTLWFRVWIACQVSELLEAADINCLTLNLT